MSEEDDYFPETMKGIIIQKNSYKRDKFAKLNLKTKKEKYLRDLELQL